MPLISPLMPVPLNATESIRMILSGNGMCVAKLHLYNRIFFTIILCLIMELLATDFHWFADHRLKSTHFHVLEILFVQQTTE